jgi:hypothetical protein
MPPSSYNKPTQFGPVVYISCVVFFSGVQRYGLALSIVSKLVGYLPEDGGIVQSLKRCLKKNRTIDDVEKSLQL